ncbi:MAG: histidine ammonia-lyase [Saprospiraceae bacterium]
MKERFSLEHKEWTIQEIVNIWKSDLNIKLSAKSIELINSSRSKLDQIIQDSDNAIYGINTGFGALCNTIIRSDELDQLQINLVRSHACGTGKEISVSLVKLILLLKIISLSKGYSGVRLELVEFLIELYNNKIYPSIPEMGSLGASGDLAPLSHLSLLCIGEGELLSHSTQINQSVKEILSQNNIQIPMLKAKEGLALLNGTQYSLALLLEACTTAEDLYHQASVISALSMEAFNCSTDFLNEEIHEIRKQKGQIFTAAQIRKILSQGNLKTRTKNSVQDPYSFRCIPQVHGASYDAIIYVKGIIENEINAVSDNPLILSNGQILSGGNFHAQPLALSSDFLSIAVSELGNISERRIYQLINGSRGLPDFLTQDAGLNSGYMIVQYSAASLVSLNKQMCTPSSVDSIVTSKGQEDHVSMAANAGLKCLGIVERCSKILSMEWMTACRAWNFRKEEWKLGSNLESIFESYREQVPFQALDHIPSLDYDRTSDFLTKLNLGKGLRNSSEITN